jgi:hypothetical protein
MARPPAQRRAFLRLPKSAIVEFVAASGRQGLSSGCGWSPGVPLKISMTTPRSRSAPQVRDPGADVPPHRRLEIAHDDPELASR